MTGEAAPTARSNRSPRYSNRPPRPRPVIDRAPLPAPVRNRPPTWAYAPPGGSGPPSRPAPRPVFFPAAEVPGSSCSPGTSAAGKKTGRGAGLEGGPDPPGGAYAQVGGLFRTGAGMGARSMTGRGRGGRFEYRGERFERAIGAAWPVIGDLPGGRSRGRGGARRRRPGPRCPRSSGAPRRTSPSGRSVAGSPRISRRAWLAPWSAPGISSSSAPGSARRRTPSGAACGVEPR